MLRDPKTDDFYELERILLIAQTKRYHLSFP